MCVWDYLFRTKKKPIKYSSTGDLYEYDRTSKPSWKKHIWSKGTAANASLIPSIGCTLHGLLGDNSISLFLLTKVISTSITATKCKICLQSKDSGKIIQLNFGVHQKKIIRIIPRTSTVPNKRKTNISLNLVYNE